MDTGPGAGGLVFSMILTTVQLTCLADFFSFNNSLVSFLKNKNKSLNRFWHKLLTKVQSEAAGAKEQEISKQRESVENKLRY